MFEVISNKGCQLYGNSYIAKHTILAKMGANDLYLHGIYIYTELHVQILAQILIPLPQTNVSIFCEIPT